VTGSSNPGVEYSNIIILLGTWEFYCSFHDKSFLHREQQHNLTEKISLSFFLYKHVAKTENTIVSRKGLKNE